MDSFVGRNFTCTISSQNTSSLFYIYSDFFLSYSAVLRKMAWLVNGATAEAIQKTSCVCVFFFPSTRSLFCDSPPGKVSSIFWWLLVDSRHPICRRRKGRKNVKNTHTGLTPSSVIEGKRNKQKKNQKRNRIHGSEKNQKEAQIFYISWLNQLHKLLSLALVGVLVATRSDKSTKCICRKDFNIFLPFLSPFSERKSKKKKR